MCVVNIFNGQHFCWHGCRICIDGTCSQMRIHKLISIVTNFAVSVIRWHWSRWLANKCKRIVLNMHAFIRWNCRLHGKHIILCHSSIELWKWHAACTELHIAQSIHVDYRRYIVDIPPHSALLCQRTETQILIRMWMRWTRKKSDKYEKWEWPVRSHRHSLAQCIYIRSRWATINSLWHFSIHTIERNHCEYATLFTFQLTIRETDSGDEVFSFTFAMTRYRWVEPYSIFTIHSPCWTMSRRSYSRS